MDRSRLVFAAHALAGSGLGILGLIRIQAGDTVGGVVNVAMSAAIVAVGVYFARRE